MFTIISTFLGILSGIIPSLISVWEKSIDLKHEKELLQLRMEAAARGLEFQIFLEDVKAGYREGESLRLHDSNLRGGKFIEPLRASVRPVITYIFFALFVVVEGAAAFVMLSSGYDVPTMLQAVWNDNTMAIFGAIMGFWFGSRAIERVLFGPPTIGVVGSRAPRSAPRDRTYTTITKER